MSHKILGKILPQRNLNAFIFIVTFIVGICSGLSYYNEDPIGDATYYFNIANLLQQSFSNLLHSPKIGVAESLNAIIQGLVFRLPGNDFLSVYILQIFVYSLTGLYIYKLTEKFIGRAGGLITLCFYLINHNHWVHIYNFKPGVWVNLFLILTVYYAFLVFRQPERRKNYLFTGVFSALLLLTDLRYLPHLLFIYFLFLFVHISISDKIKNISLSAGIIVILIAPWIIRQSMVFDRFIFISDLNTMTIHRALNTGHYRSLSNHAGTLAPLSDDEYNRRFWGLKDSLGLTPGELIYARGEAKKIILNSSEIPLSVKYRDLIESKKITEKEITGIIKKEEEQLYLINLIKRAGYLWAPFNFRYIYDPLSTYKKFYPPSSLISNLNRIITLGIFLPFLFAGLFYLIRKRDLFTLMLTGILMIHTMVHVLTYVQWRYMLPVLPLVTMVAVYGYMKFIESVKKRQFVLKKSSD